MLDIYNKVDILKQPAPGKKIVKKPKVEKKKKACRYGTSKLEVYFMEEFLDKLDIEYVYQKEFKSLKRVFDFYFPTLNILLEVDGCWWHSDPRFYDQKQLNPMQKKNKRVDEQKNYWVAMNGIPLIRIWEYDIHNNSENVMSMLKERFGLEKEKKLITEAKKTGEFFKKKTDG